MSGRGTGRYGGTRDEDEDDLGTRLRDNATGIASLLVTGIWLAGLLTNQSWWLPALIVGYAAVIPVVAVLFGDEDAWNGEQVDSGTGSNRSTTDSHETNARDALETLRERYAAGELTDEQFERKLERLLDTETLEDADEWVREHSDNGSRDRDRERDREYDR